MRIIADGKKPDTDISRIFRCKLCQCLFEADKGEYEWVWTNPPDVTGDSFAFHLEAKCPCCNMSTEIIDRMFIE